MTHEVKPVKINGFRMELGAHQPRVRCEHERLKTQQKYTHVYQNTNVETFRKFLN